MNPLTIVFQSEDLKLMERALESYEKRLIQAAKELDHYGLSSEQAWEDATKIKSLFRRTLDQHVNQNHI